MSPDKMKPIDKFAAKYGLWLFVRCSSTSRPSNAGIALMQAASPDGWRGVADASDLVRVNQEALTACREAAAKAKKEQRCTITVPAQ